jgi:hypothetical protein
MDNDNGEVFWKPTKFMPRHESLAIKLIVNDYSIPYDTRFKCWRDFVNQQF